MTALADIVKDAQKRASDQNQRVLKYRDYTQAYYGRKPSSGIRGSYADGRPALKDQQQMEGRLGSRPSPNMIKPIIDDVVSVAGGVPTITFDPEDDSDASHKVADTAARAVRGMYEMSRMDVGQANAAFFLKLFGDACYTLDPLRPKDIDKNDPFAQAGVYINVHDPSYAYPKFGSGREFNRIQDLYLIYEDVAAEDIKMLYPDVRNLTTSKAMIVVWYTKKFKSIMVSQQASGDPQEVYRDDHEYGFCPAEWAVNKATGSQMGLSEIDQASDLHSTSGMLFNLAVDSAISATFPIYHAHNAEHVGKLRLGPGALVETSEDGKFELLAPQANSHIAMSLLDMTQDNLLKQTGTAPVRIEGGPHHANISQRAQSGGQAPMEQRLALSQTILGSTLEWVNAKIALMLYKDRDLKKAEMTVYLAKKNGQGGRVTFKGDDLGGLWRNHVSWKNLLGGNEHEQLAMAMQLEKDGMYSGRKVLERIGDEDPERTLDDAKAWQIFKLTTQAQAQTQAQSAAQGQPPPGGPPSGPGGPPGEGPPGGPPPGGMPPGMPPGMGDAAQPPPPPPASAGMPPRPPVSASPADSPAGATSPPDIQSEVAQAINASSPQLMQELVEYYGIPGGLFVHVSDQRYVPVVRTILRPVVEQIFGPGAKLIISLKPRKGG